MDGNPQQLYHIMQGYCDAEKSNEIDRFPFLVNILQDLTDKISYEITLKDLLQTMDDFITCIQDEALQCNHKSKRAMHLAKTIIDMLYIFKSIGQNYFGEMMATEYYNRTSKMLTTYVDMELKASVKAKMEHASIADHISTNIDSHLQAGQETQILDVFINMTRITNVHKDILLKLFQKYLYCPIVLHTRELDDDAFIKYVILFKIWKNIESNPAEKRRISEWCVSFVKPTKNLWQNKRLKLLLGNDLKEYNAEQLVAYMCTNVAISELRRYTRIVQPTVDEDHDSDVEEIRVELAAATCKTSTVNTSEQLIDICNIKMEKPTVVDSIDLTEEETPLLPLDETRIRVKFRWLENLCHKSSAMKSTQFFVPDSLVEPVFVEILDDEPTPNDSLAPERSGQATRTYERVSNHAGCSRSIMNKNDPISDGDSEESAELFSSLTATDADTSSESHTRITNEIINDWEATAMDEDDGTSDHTKITAPRTAITVSLPLQFINERHLLEKSSLASTSVSNGVPQKKSNLKTSQANKRAGFSLPMDCAKSPDERPTTSAAVRFAGDSQRSPVSSNVRFQSQKPPTLNLLKKPTILEKKTYIDMPQFLFSGNWRSSLATKGRHFAYQHNSSSLAGKQADQAVAQFFSKYNSFIEDSDSEEEASHTQLIYHNKCQAMVQPEAIDSKTFKSSVHLPDILKVIAKTRNEDDYTASTLFRRSQRYISQNYVKYDNTYLDKRLFEPDFKGQLLVTAKPVICRSTKRKTMAAVAAACDSAVPATGNSTVANLKTEKKSPSNKTRKRNRSLWSSRRRVQRKKGRKKPNVNIKPVVAETVVDDYPRAFSTRKKVNSFSDSNSANLTTPHPAVGLEITSSAKTEIRKPVKVYRSASKPPEKVTPPQKLDSNVTVKVVLTKCDTAARPYDSRDSRPLDRVKSLSLRNRRFCSADNLEAPLKERLRLRPRTATPDSSFVHRSRTKSLFVAKVENPIVRAPSPVTSAKPNESTPNADHDAWDDLVNKPLNILDRSDTKLMENHVLHQPEDHTLMVTALLNAAEGVQNEMPILQESCAPMPQLTSSELAASSTKSRRKNRPPKLDHTALGDPKIEPDVLPMNLSISEEEEISLHKRRGSKHDQSTELSLKSRKILQVNKFVKGKAKNISTDDEAELVKNDVEPVNSANLESAAQEKMPEAENLGFLEREMQILDFPAQKVKLKPKLKEPRCDSTKPEDQKVSSPTVDTTEDQPTLVKKGNRKRKPTRIVDDQQPEIATDQSKKQDERKPLEENIVESSTTEVLVSPTKQQETVKPGNSRKILMVHKFRKTTKLLEATMDKDDELQSAEQPRTPEKTDELQVDDHDFLECDDNAKESEDTSPDMQPENPKASLEEDNREAILPKRLKRIQRKRKMFLPKRRRKLSKPAVAERILTPEPNDEEESIEVKEAMTEDNPQQTLSICNEQSVSETSEMSLDYSEISGHCDDDAGSVEDIEENRLAELKATENANASESSVQVTEEVSFDSDELFIESREAATFQSNLESDERNVKKKIRTKFSRKFLAKRRLLNKSARHEKAKAEIDEKSAEMSTTTKNEPVSEEDSPDEDNHEAEDPSKANTESPIPHTSTDHNTNFDAMFMDCLSSSQKDIINDNSLAFDMTAANNKPECGDEDGHTTHNLNEVLNTAHPRSEEEDEIRANKYFDGMSNHLNNTALIDSTISLCHDYDNHQKEVDSPLYMDGVDMIATHTATTETDEEDAAALNNDTHVETTMNQIYDILTNEKEEAAGSTQENDSSLQITSTLMGEPGAGSSNGVKKSLQQPQQQQPDFDMEIPQNAIFDQSLLQKLIDKKVLITPVNTSVASLYTSTYSNDVSSTIKSPKDDHTDSSFVCKADSTNPVAKAKRTYTRKRLTKRPPKIDISLQHKLPTRPVNHLDPACMPSSSSASPNSETKSQQLFGNFANPAPHRHGLLHHAPLGQHGGGTTIVLAPVTHSKTSVKLVQYISNPGNVVGNPKSFCTISNNLIGKHNFVMQPTHGPHNYTITSSNKAYANHTVEHDSNSSTSSSSSVNLEQQQQLHRVNSSEHAHVLPQPKPVVMPAQFYIINKKSPTNRPVPVMYSPPPMSRKTSVQSVQVMSSAPILQALQSPSPKKRGRPKGSKNKSPTALQTEKSPTVDGNSIPLILNKKKRALQPHALLALQQQQRQANKMYSHTKRKVYEIGSFVDDEDINMCGYTNTMQRFSSTATATATSGYSEPAPTIHPPLLANRGHDLLSSVASASNNDEQLTPPEIMQPPMQQNLIIDYTTNLCHGGDTFIDSLNDIESASVHSYHDDDFGMIDSNR